MLAKILEDMWVEPEVLEALSEEQKRILFLKMREEQVRRWREPSGHVKPERLSRSTADNKHVRWLLGRDGDVSVIVIGEVDEFRSSKLLQRLMNNRVGRVRRAARLNLTCPNCVQDDPASPRDHWSEEDPAEDSDSESGGSSDNHGDWTPLSEPHLGSRGDRAPLEAQLSETERAGPQDAGRLIYRLVRCTATV
uniref:Uncharacterized protein n=1 Tax=Cyclopterus lumpus TaxID=8103 RepID=A0A8C3AHT2_CYCLU